MKNYTNVRVFDKSWGFVRLQFIGYNRAMRYRRYLFLTMYDKTNKYAWYKFEIGNGMQYYRPKQHEKAIKHMNSTVQRDVPSLFWS